ncbi:TetR/AcrR family transcriptional regulator [Pseudonocardia endophytica]|uniref:TetR family transcriptional regulator n=1 Tax=Pseudonocardia endophytica TaxID=401976 RepID=A0A4R1HJ46_PSEEN|nr:TetR/AcrR family transcriptional regulator [Pseudonocardia endophytica]TCK20913.1 TetR family transcriptional regulator [Pseudonocardia endophytica]
MDSEIDRRRRRAKNQGRSSYNRRRDEILRAAASVFRDKGFSRTNFSEVAAELGMDRASLYYYVGGKDELFSDVVLDALTENVRAATAVQESSASPPEKVRTLLRDLFRSYVEFYPFQVVYLQENLEHIAEDDAQWLDEIRALENVHFEYVESIVQEGVDDGSIREVGPPWLMTRALLGMVASTARWYEPGETAPDPERLGDTFSSILLVGIASDLDPDATPPR